MLYDTALPAQIKSNTSSLYSSREQLGSAHNAISSKDNIAKYTVHTVGVSKPKPHPKPRQPKVIHEYVNVKSSTGSKALARKPMAASRTMSAQSTGTGYPEPNDSDHHRPYTVFAPEQLNAAYSGLGQAVHYAVSNVVPRSESVDSPLQYSRDRPPVIGTPIMDETATSKYSEREKSQSSKDTLAECHRLKYSESAQGKPAAGQCPAVYMNVKQAPLNFYSSKAQSEDSKSVSDTAQSFNFSNPNSSDQDVIVRDQSVIEESADTL